MYVEHYYGNQLGPDAATTLMEANPNAAQSILAYLEHMTEGGDGLELVNELLAFCTPAQADRVMAKCRAWEDTLNG